MRWVGTPPAKSYKLLVSIVILTILNTTSYHLTKADLEPAIKQDMVLIEEPSSYLKIEEVLWKDKDAKKHLGTKIPRVAMKAVELRDRYKDEGLTLSIIMGVIKVESSFNPRAISKGPDGFTPVAYGLMQVVRSTASPILKNMGKVWTTELALQPEFSMEVGVFHLMELHRRFVIKGVEEMKEFHLSLIAYNRGEQLVLDAIDMSKRVPVSLEYLGKVKVASTKWGKIEF